MLNPLKPFPPKVAPRLMGALRSATAPIHQAVALNEAPEFLPGGAATVGVEVPR